ncbi:hypothetical protein [Candidatus Kryptobacter tengchongensis]|uniref:DUF4296 domain-containing protein n=2 Tax=Kryptobacter tengchongensis TaxID=1643429 RepID=A0A656DBK0_KRYT1|nr:hypothetical protein [Candidatus Kryptobacter tengchongensis]CUS80242.1 hypothetical protein JGI20_00029 [Candidatus Kryptobacter tengchongensis]CUT04268.1 hypothetical protein JGI24_01458 [Candidatus Kryptobacter tengchongensis]
MRVFRKTYILILTLAFFVSCGSEKGEDKDKKFVQVYAEILYLTEKFKTDTIQLKTKIDSVLSVNQVEMKQIDSIASSYGKDPKKWSEFFDKVKKYLDEKSLNVRPKKH